MTDNYVANQSVNPRVPATKVQSERLPGARAADKESTHIGAGSILIVGPTGGLGGALLESIARRRPAHLVLLGRPSTQFEGAEALASRLGAGTVTRIPVDLADLDDVARAGKAVTELVTGGAPALTSLVLNAGMQTTHRRQLSAQGLERTFAVNVVASHVLLRTVIASAAPIANVTLVGSGTHFGDWHSYGMVPRPRWEDPVDLARPDTENGAPDPKSGPRAYATSKLGVLYLAHAWQTRYEGRLRVNVFDPGLMPGTGLAREQPGPALWAWKHVMPAFTFLPGWSTPRASAERLAALALGEQHADLAGGYNEMGQVRKSSAESYDNERETRLWDFCEKTFSDRSTRPHGSSRASLG